MARRLTRGFRRGGSWRKSRRWCGARRESRVEAGGSRIAARLRVARVAVFVVEFDELHFGELFEVRHERQRNVVERAIRLTRAQEINMRDAVRKFDAAVASESVRDERQTLIALESVGTFEEFIQRGADEIARRGNGARHWNFIRQLTVEQAVVIGEINVHLQDQRRAARRGRIGNSRR